LKKKEKREIAPINHSHEAQDARDVCISLFFATEPYERDCILQKRPKKYIFCKRALQTRLYPAKETYVLKEPTNLAHMRHKSNVMAASRHGVAAIGRLHKIIGLFCKI